MAASPFFVDHALSARIEAASAAQTEGLARAVAAQLPGRGFAVAEIAGGRAVFIVPHTRVSRAVGLGMSGPVEASDVEALEDFYASRDTEARILVSPFAHPSLLARLGERGFRLDELEAVLVRRLDPAEEVSLPAGFAMQRAPNEQAPSWVTLSFSAFAGPWTSNAQTDVFEAGFHSPGASHFFGLLNGSVAGTAALYLHERTAYLYAGGTVPEVRRRGVQRGMIDARLEVARSARCDLAFSITQPGSGSQRNLERAGFSAAYSLALLIK